MDLEPLDRGYNRTYTCDGISIIEGVHVVEPVGWGGLTRFGGEYSCHQ